MNRTGFSELRATFISSAIATTAAVLATFVVSGWLTRRSEAKLETQLKETREPFYCVPVPKKTIEGISGYHPYVGV